MTATAAQQSPVFVAMPTAMGLKQRFKVGKSPKIQIKNGLPTNTWRRFYAGYW